MNVHRFSYSLWYALYSGLLPLWSFPGYHVAYVETTMLHVILAKKLDRMFDVLIMKEFY